jgi:hypothetical protein
MKKTISLDFCDFPASFSKTDNYFVRFLSKHFTISICDKPDFVIYSNYGHIHRLHSGVKIYYTEECWAPDFNACDYALSFDYIDNPRHYRLPNYVAMTDPSALSKSPEEAAKILQSKTKFCAFIVGYSDSSVKKRTDFFYKLSKYKHVDSAGRGLNNIGGPLPWGYDKKIDFLKSYKFHICFENNARPGYTSEKLVNAMQANTIPLYWGDPLVNRNFNSESFLNLADYQSEEALIEKVIELDQNDEKYIEIMSKPWVKEGQPNPLFEEDKLVEFFEKIFSASSHPLASKKDLFKFNRWRLVKINK